MTEEKPKRSYWRRGPRKKKGMEDAAGTAAAAPPVTKEGDAGETFAPSSAEEHGDSSSAGMQDDMPQAPVEIVEAEETLAGEAGEGIAPKKGRRRSRRRGKKKPDVLSEAGGPEPSAETAFPGEAPAGEAAAVPPEAEEPGSFEYEGGIEGEAAPGEAMLPVGIAPPGAEALPGSVAEPRVEPGEPGKRRRRRRRRRRGKGKGAPQGETGGAFPAASDEEPESDDVGSLAAGGTEAEEPDVVPEYLVEAEDEEEEAFPQEGSGAKKVMLIDGLHSEENRVAIVADGNLDYYEVENQRRKAFKGNIYKAKVVNIAHAIEAAFVEFGGGRHGFLPLNEYCAGALMEHLGTWNEGDKRPPLRPGMEILVQVTKEESAIKGAAVTSYISIAGRYMVMMLGMKRYGISKKITGEKERERIRKQMEKLEYPDHLGFIVRTVGASRPLKDLKDDLTNLLKLWDRTVEGARANKAPALLYEEQDIVIRTLRDNYSADVMEVLMNS